MNWYQMETISSFVSLGYAEHASHVQNETSLSTHKHQLYYLKQQCGISLQNAIFFPCMM